MPAHILIRGDFTMCGIALWFDENADMYGCKDIIDNMSDTLKVRGPDERGEYLNRDLALIHRRLSVVDIAHGKQPMTYENDYGKYVIVYNGELYNTEEVRTDLRRAGMTFDGYGDTEVVLKAFVCWGKDCVKRFNGIFAFGVWSQRDNSLFLARDRIGVKPLYYSQYSGGFLAASRLRTILASRRVRPVVDETGLNELFMLGPGRSIGNGIYKEIQELPPGHCMIYRDGRISIEPYWTLEAKEHTDTLDQTVDKTLYLVRDAIERQLVSDVPLATFLSGGLDSSIISKVASDSYKAGGKAPLHTYSVDYVDNEKYFQKSLFQPNSDQVYIQMMAEAIGSEHHNIVIENEKLADALVDAAVGRDLPGMADVDASLLLFCREVKEDFTVTLSGECADEIFGGYPWYHNREILFDDTFPWSRSTALRKSILKDGLLPGGDDYVEAAYRKTVDETRLLGTESPLEKRMKEMFMLNLNWFMQTLLVRKATMSMESSLEVRVPFCDYRIVEYAYNMPWSMKALDGREKGILRKAVEHILPEEIVWRKKSPYPKTHNPLYYQIVCDHVREILGEKGNFLAEILNHGKIYDIMEHPESIPIPWYGQLMQAPQIMAYLIQTDTWIKDNHVEFDL
ncbi:MAG: asparagine synthase (glutamine-hydrolyzing) [Clostridiales bacterium]|nr:asparagine synthase (glutamine-hydrolyzing) [Clostridiales bacterium]